jgi:hypothetical protein
MSFMIIRLLQNFTSVDLHLSSAPPEAHPPAAWAEASGRKGVEKLLPKMHLTMYTHVSLSTKTLRSLLNTASLSGWFVGQDD